MDTLLFGKIRKFQHILDIVDSQDLVLILSQAQGEQFYLIYNCAKLPEMPSTNLKARILQADLSLPANYDGLVVGYPSLDLILPDLPTHGINFFNIRDIMQDRETCYRQNAYRLAVTLLAYLERFPAEGQSTLADRRRLKIIRLALPELLAGRSLDNVLAIIPNGDLHNFIKQDQSGYSLFCYNPDIANLQTAWQTAVNQAPWIIGLEETAQLFSTISNGPSIISLRPLLLEMDKREELSVTCRSLAAWCWQIWQQSKDDACRERAYALAAESWLIHDDVDDLVALFPALNFQDFLDNGGALRIYRTPRIHTNSDGNGMVHALGDLVHNKITAPHYATVPIAFPILKPVLRFITAENVLDLGPILWRVGHETEIARTFWLLSRDLLRLPAPTWSVINAAPDTITVMAQQAVLIYSLQNPWRWRQGRYTQFLQQSYQHLLDCLLNQETLASSETAAQYYKLLRVWYGCALTDDLVRSLGELSRTGQTLQNLFDKAELMAASERHQVVELLAQISERLLQATSVTQGIPPVFSKEALPFFEVYTFLQSIVRTDPPILPPSRPFLQWLKAYETLHEQWLGIQENLAAQRPSFEKLDALLGNYQHLAQLIHAPAHELAVLKWTIAQDINRINRLKEAVETGPIIQISLRNPWMNPGLRERLRLDVENLGGATAYQFQLELMPSSQFERFTQPTVLIIDAFPPGQQNRLNWEIRAREPTVRLNINFHYLDHHGKPHSNREVLVLHTRPQGSDQLKPTGNLYQAGPPVSGIGRFFGRRHEIEQILSRLIGGITQPILLRGPRRMGKTSILRQLEWLLKTNKELRTMDLTPKQELQLGACIPVFHTLQSIKDPDDTASFFQTIYEDICEALGLTFDPNSLSRLFHRSPTRAFMKQMARIFAERPHIRPLVIVDEWDELYRPAYARLAINLRALMEGEVRVNWVVSSTWTLSEEAGRYGSPFYNQAFTIELGAMAWEPAVELVTLPGQKMGLNWHGEAVVALLELTGRRPYLIQLLCSKLTDYLRVKNSNIVDTEAVSVIANQIVREAQATTQYFGFLWKDEQGESLDGVNWMGRLILWALDRHYPRPLTRAEIRETIETELIRRDLSIPHGAFFGQEFNNQITQLQWIFDAIALEGDRYAFPVPLIQRWLRLMIDQQEDPILQAYNDMVIYQSGTIET